MIQAEGDADVEITKAAVTKSAFKSTTDLLLLLLYYAEATNYTELSFSLDKIKSNVYNIKVLKKILEEAVCDDWLFIHAFTGCDSTSRVFGIGKKLGCQRIIKLEQEIKDSSKVLLNKAKSGCCGNQ